MIILIIYSTMYLRCSYASPARTSLRAREGLACRMRLRSDDYALITIRSMTAGSCTGSDDQPPELVRDQRDGALID